MRWLRNIQVRTRLVSVLVLLNILLFAAVGFGWHAIGRVQAELESAVSLHNRFETATARLNGAQVQFKAQVLAWKNLMLRGGDPEQLAYYEKGFATAAAKVQEHLVAVRGAMEGLGMPGGPAEAAAARHAELLTKYAEALAAIKAGTPMDQADRLVAKTNRAAMDQIDGLAQILEERGDQIDGEIVKASNREKSRLEYELAALAAFAALFSAAAGWALVVGISRPLRRATEVARTVAAGDLTARIEVSGNDEFAALLRSLKNMNEALADIVLRVRKSSESVMSASSQIAAGNHDLSARTEEQASSLEETAASIEEMAATVGLNAQNSRAASELAASAATIARRGGDAVHEVVRNMSDIHEHSRRIVDIIGVIDSIAFQTNILALNAAVEAARAGDQGRGFAVVASEVRALAQRTATAAKEVKALIVDSVERVDAGARLAHDAGATMGEVVGSVNRVTAIIADIARATDEQSSGISQVSAAAGNLDKATQQNAALVEQSTASSESLMRMAREMAEAVETFQVGAVEETRARPPQGPRPAAIASSRPVKALPAAAGGAPLPGHDWRAF